MCICAVSLLTRTLLVDFISFFFGLSCFTHWGGRNYFCPYGNLHLDAHLQRNATQQQHPFPFHLCSAIIKLFFIHSATAITMFLAKERLCWRIVAVARARTYHASTRKYRQLSEFVHYESSWVLGASWETNVTFFGRTPSFLHSAFGGKSSSQIQFITAQGAAMWSD